MLQLPVFILGGCAAVLINKIVQNKLTQSEKPINNKNTLNGGANDNSKKINPVSDNGNNSGGDNSQTRTESNSLNEEVKNVD